MKKIFVAMLALAAATACSNDELVSVNREAIAFDNAFINNSVRSVVDPSYKYDSKMFADFAVYGFVSADNQAPAAIFDGTQVSGPDWTYEGTQYWIAGANYNFHAVAPMTDGGWTKTAASKDAVTLEFTNNGTTDLLYALTAQQGKAEGNPQVAFDFRHILSKVKFSFENAYNATNATIKVKNIAITNAYASGTVVLDADTEWTGTGSTPLNFGMATDNEATEDKEDVEIAYAYGKTYESQNELLLIPGAVTGDYNVTFTVELLVDKTLVKTYNHKATVAFAPVAGYSYDIKAIINADNIDPEHKQEPIEFTVNTLPGWKTGTVDDITNTTVNN